MFTISKRRFIATIFGNILEHYDRALYGLIAPFIAKLFYPECHPITALILAYLPVSLLFRPLGALFFGRLGDRLGRARAFQISIVGMSLMVLGVGLAPTYAQVGILSAFILHFFRGMICFFAVGEGTAAALLLVENAPAKRRDMMSSVYAMSSILGVVIASLLVTSFVYQNRVELSWRWLFMISGILGLVIFKARSKMRHSDTLPKPLEKISFKEIALPFCAIVFVTGFSYGNYMLLSELMNGYIPIICDLTGAQMMHIQSWLVLYDFALLPFFGFCAQKFGKEKMIFLALLWALVGVFPLCRILYHPTFLNVLILRMIFVTWGIMLAAPYEHWMSTLVPKNKRFRTIALAKAIGSQTIGAPAISITLWLFHETKWVLAPAVYIFACAFLALFSLGLLYRNNSKQLIFGKPNIADPSDR